MIEFVVYIIFAFALVAEFYNLHKRFHKIENRLELIIEKLDNGVLTDLKRIVSTELRDLRSWTNADKGMWAYWTRKTERLYYVFQSIKKDLNNMNDRALIDSIKTGTPELKIAFNYNIENVTYSYPDEFLSYVDHVNEVTISNFQKKCLSEISYRSVSNSVEKLEIIKGNLYDCFSDNVRMIYQKYIETRHLIKDPDFLLYKDL